MRVAFQQPGQHDERAVLAEPLFYNTAITSRDAAEPLAPPPEPLPPGLPITVRQLLASPEATRQHPALQAAYAAIPPEWMQAK